MSASSSKTVVLLVEDDIDLHRIIREALEFDGYAVISGNNGREALDAIQKAGLPDVILLDMRMPVMDGWQFAAEFRAQFGRSVPIIAVTAAADALRRASEIQADACLRKPFQWEELLSTVKRLAPSRRSPP